MALKVGLAAAGLLALSLCGAKACDDFDEEKALAAARQAPLVQAAEAAPPAAGGATLPDRAEPSGHAAATPAPQPQIAASPIAAVRQ